MQLRPYQEQIIDKTRAAIVRCQRVLMQGPTGMGKTAISVYMMARAAEQGKRAFFLVHQNELLQQTSKALWAQKLEHGQAASGKSISKLPLQVASVQTLVNRLDRYEPPHLIIIDECHRSTSSTYQRILDAWPRAKVVGLTATPQRTDGKGLGEVYQELVLGPSINSLMAAGYLSQYEVLAPPSTLDLNDIHSRAGDYAKDELEAAMDRPSITGDAVATYIKHATGKRCVVMCVSIRHAEHVRDSYLAAGVSCEMIEGKMTNNEREQVLDRFRRGETMVISQCELLIAGVDIPSIEVIQWLRPTQSVIIWMQGNGRGLRPAPGKERLLILDHVGNWQRHGLPDDEREWSLDGRKKGTRKASDEPETKVQQCAECYHIFRPGVDRCPSCGSLVPVKGKPELQVVEGDLVRVDAELIRKQDRQQQGAARTLIDLVALGMRKGLKRPDGWAAHVLASRAGRRPTQADYSEARTALMTLRARA